MITFCCIVPFRMCSYFRVVCSSLIAKHVRAHEFTIQKFFTYHFTICFVAKIAMEVINFSYFDILLLFLTALKIAQCVKVVHLDSFVQVYSLLWYFKTVGTKSSNCVCI